MDAVTYPQEKVQKFVQEHFIPCRLELSKEQDLAQKLGAAWTPTLQFIDPQMEKVRQQFTGFLPPDDFLSQCYLAIGQSHFQKKDHDKAKEWFLKVEQDFPKSSDIPETLYWAAVNDYKKVDKPDGLLEIWKKILAHYPNSPWAKKVSFIEKK